MKKSIVVLLTLIPLLALANGSTTGHNNGHHDWQDGSSQTVSNEIAVDNQVDVANSARSDSASHSSVGNLSATGGKSSSAAGDSQSSIGSITVSGDSNDYSASSAADVYTNICQSGMSGQTRSGGFGASSPDQFCKYIDMANAAWLAHERAKKNPDSCKTITATVTCDEPGHMLCEIEQCQSDAADKHLAMYHDNLERANKLLVTAEQPALWDRVAGFLIKPLALVAGVAKFLL